MKRLSVAALIFVIVSLTLSATSEVTLSFKGAFEYQRYWDEENFVDFNIRAGFGLCHFTSPCFFTMNGDILFSKDLENGMMGFGPYLSFSLDSLNPDRITGMDFVLGGKIKYPLFFLNNELFIGLDLRKDLIGEGTLKFDFVGNLRTGVKFGGLSAGAELGISGLSNFTFGAYLGADFEFGEDSFARTGLNFSMSTLQTVFTDLYLGYKLRQLAPFIKVKEYDTNKETTEIIEVDNSEEYNRAVRMCRKVSEEKGIYAGIECSGKKFLVVNIAQIKRIIEEGNLKLEGKCSIPLTRGPVSSCSLNADYDIGDITKIFTRIEGMEVEVSDGLILKLKKMDGSFVVDDMDISGKLGFDDEFFKKNLWKAKLKSLDMKLRFKKEDGSNIWHIDFGREEMYALVGLNGFSFLPSKKIVSVKGLKGYATASLNKKDVIKDLLGGANTVEVVDEFGNKVKMTLKDIETGDTQTVGKKEATLKLSYNKEDYEYEYTFEIVPDFESLVMYIDRKKTDILKKVIVASDGDVVMADDIVFKDRFGNVANDYIKNIDFIGEGFRLEYTDGKLILRGGLRKAGVYGKNGVSLDVYPKNPALGVIKGKIDKFEFCIVPDLKSVKSELNFGEIEASEFFEVERKLDLVDRFGNPLNVMSMKGRVEGVAHEGFGSFSYEDGKITLENFNKKGVHKVKPRIESMTVKFPDEIEKFFENNGIGYELEDYKRSAVDRISPVISVVIKPSKPDRLAVLDAETNEKVDTIFMPTYKDEEITKSFSVTMVDRFGNVIDEVEKYLKDIEISSEGLKISAKGRGFNVSNLNQTVPSLKTVVFRSGGNEIGKMNVRIVPVPRVVKDISTEKAFFSFAIIKATVEDGNGNPVPEAPAELVFDDLRKFEGQTDENGEVRFAVMFGSMGDHSALVRVKKTVVKQFTAEKKQKVKITSEEVNIKKLVLADESLSNLKIGQRALAPVISPSGKYVAYSILSVYGGEFNVMLIIQDIDTGKKTNIFQMKGRRKGREKAGEDLAKQVVYSYRWHPVTDILVYTPFDEGSFNVYAYSVETGKKYKIYSSERNDIEPMFNPKGDVMIWNSGGNVMKAKVSISSGRMSLSDVSTLVPKGEFANIMISYSNDGKYVAFSRNNDLYIYDIENRTTIRVTNSPAIVERDFSWSPDSKKLVYYSTTEKGTRYTLNLYDMETKKIEILYEDVNPEYGYVTWFTNTKFIFYAADKPEEEPLMVYDLSNGKSDQISVEPVGKAILFKNVNLFVKVKGDEIRPGAILRAFDGNDSIYKADVEVGK